MDSKHKGKIILMLGNAFEQPWSASTAMAGTGLPHGSCVSEVLEVGDRILTTTFASGLEFQMTENTSVVLCVSNFFLT